MLARKTCCAEFRLSTAAVLPRRSVIVRMRSVANSSKQPGCTPASSVIGEPSSSAITSGAAKFTLMSTTPAPSARAAGTPLAPTGPGSMYWMSVKPSARNNSSARYCGATQMLRSLMSRRRVVSGGGSVAANAGALAARPTEPTAYNSSRRVSTMFVMVFNSFLS